jgi:hypothetical protein
MNSLVQDNDDFQVHQLETVDVIEDEDGILISDFYGDSEIYISNDELLDLYGILKDRFFSED